jgi:hypothetical protein
MPRAITIGEAVAEKSTVLRGAVLFETVICDSLFRS